MEFIYLHKVVAEFVIFGTKTLKNLTVRDH
jgi:hypothetical protein